MSHHLHPWLWFDLTYCPLEILEDHPARKGRISGIYLLDLVAPAAAHIDEHHSVFGFREAICQFIQRVEVQPVGTVPALYSHVTVEIFEVLRTVR